MDGPRPRFLCDAMLGSLARWLRLSGFDCAYLQPGPADEQLARQATAEGRWILTRDRAFAAAGPRRTLVRAERVDDQLAEVASRLGLVLDPRDVGTRCAECNAIVDLVPRETAVPHVPPYVARTADRFRRCRGCGRFYWAGTHSDRIRSRLEQIRRQVIRDCGPNGV